MFTFYSFLSHFLYLIIYQDLLIILFFFFLPVLWY